MFKLKMNYLMHLNMTDTITVGSTVICDDKCKSKDIKLPYFIMIFASCHFVLSQLPNFHSISGVSLAAAVMSLWYTVCIISFTACLLRSSLPSIKITDMAHERLMGMAAIQP